jgi:hypothetical protein
LYVGSLFCLFDDGGEAEPSASGTFLYVHKIDIILLEDIEHAFHIRVLRNEEEVY